jgi:serine/threonine-protein kinase
MATVFLGTLEGALGFRQLVAIKRPHPHLLEDASFRAALLREAKLAAGIHHANVVDVRDVELVGDAVQLVMDYIEGASLGELVGARARAGQRVPPGIAVRIVLDACAGLHAAHELTDEAGRPLGLVHRDVSPQNVLVGVDGVARVTDFGIAKCIESSDPGSSRETLKGKAGYMAPEYVRGEPVDRRADVFALGVVLWEALCGKRCFRGQSDAETLERVLSAPVARVSEAGPDLAPLDDAVARALARDPAARYPTADVMARAIEQAAAPRGLVAGPTDVARFVRETVADRLEDRRRAIRAALRDAPASVPPVPPPAPAASLPREASATVPDRLRRTGSRNRVALAIAGALLLAAAGAAAVVRSRGTPPPVPSLDPPASSSPSAAATSPAPPPTVATAPPPTETASVAPSRGRPAHPPTRATVRPPPPNPYPTSP